MSQQIEDDARKMMAAGKSVLILVDQVSHGETLSKALGIPFAPPLAMIAGILEAIPTLGPILSAIPAAIVALTISPQMALVVVFTYWLIQMLENY